MSALSSSLSSTSSGAAMQNIGQAAKSADPKTAAAAKDFEAVFISEMFSHMFEGVEVDPMFGGGQGEKMFRGMLVQQYGKMMANNGNGIGIGDQLQKMMIQMQEKGTKA